jgi:hypothetical protein
MNTEETRAPYSRETLERLTNLLKQYNVTPWLNPVTNSICVKSSNFSGHNQWSRGLCSKDRQDIGKITSQ